MKFEVIFLREKMIRFMQGRYGADAFSKFLSFLAVILMALPLFIPRFPFYILGIAVIIYGYFRMFSKNISKRYQENLLYMKYKNQMTKSLRKKKLELAQRKTHHIYRCPQCRQKIRVPRGRGRIAIRCPKCNVEFIKKS